MNKLGNIPPSLKEGRNDAPVRISRTVSPKSDRSPALPPRKTRRRLKKSVKRTLVLVLMFVLLICLKPWRRFATSPAEDSNQTVSTEETNPTALNQILSNQDSEIPEAARFDRAVDQFIRKWDIRGASLAVMKDGNLIYAKGYGYADVKDSVEMEVRHIMRIASVSKLITAVGIMKLYEGGKLKLNSHVFGPQGILDDSIFSDYKDKRINDITVENLLRHQGGFSIRAGDPMFQPMEVAQSLGRKSAIDMNSMIVYGLEHGIRYRPGTRTAYSNLGYLVLSKVIEKVSGQNYETYIKEHVLFPAGCYDMHLAFNNPEDRYPNEVRYYETEDTGLVTACDGSGRMVTKCCGGNDVRGLSGAGGWVASPTELLKFIAAIDGDDSKPDILKKETIQMMIPSDDKMLPFGWMHAKTNGEWTRTGTMSGTNAMLKKQSNGYTWVFIANTSSWKGPRFHHSINNMLRQAFDRVTEWPEKDMFQADNNSAEANDTQGGESYLGN